MSKKHHRITSQQPRQSLLCRGYLAALTSLISLLGFPSCANRKQLKADDAKQPQIEKTDPLRRPVLMYGVRPAPYKEVKG